MLQQRLQTAVTQWAASGFPQPTYPALPEILTWAQQPTATTLRLRPPQWQALATYWYLRLHLDTPHVLALYQQLFPVREEWLAALQIPPQAWQHTGGSQEQFLNALRMDDAFVQRYRLESLRETATLRYPSYVLALAMGVGKTVLIGSIIATEFALAQEYPTGPFVQNALVFAPGRTITAALRELIAMPYAAVLPPHLHRPFAAAVKFTVTQDGERTIPVLQGSTHNIVITNTEKIRIQKEKIRKRHLDPRLASHQQEGARQEIANLRLQTLASLPRLAIFSDEAHHTYGQALGSGLKKVRKTVDYLAAQTEVVCVINTTGTPYYKRQPLRDVVVWYGLAAGIRDQILKEVADNIITYSLAGSNAEQTLDLLLVEVLHDFWARYQAVTLPDGTPAKLAIYFPKTADIARARPLIEQTLVTLGAAPTLLLEHHTHCDHQADFDRFRQRQSPHRIALLVDRGVEGWDVPALFACALLRPLKTSNNFVLQAAARCLRQVPGNSHPARIYLSQENQTLLERQLRATYGESIQQLLSARPAGQRPPTVRAESTTWPLPQTAAMRWTAPTQLILHRPVAPASQITRRAHGLHENGLTNPSTTTQFIQPLAPIDRYQAAVALARRYRLALWLVYDALGAAYPEAWLPRQDLPQLCHQIEAQFEGAHLAVTQPPTAPFIQQPAAQPWQSAE
ncbi:MAG: DEAD/DEAH box helicase family protein [Caldilineaceae bacterium]|nr:DEAD/DEAH box helicase family protein [Caldilineaceae bacterium]